MARTVEIEVSDQALAALRSDPQGYALELRLAAAVKLYELGQVSQEVAADIAGLPRAEFLTALSRYRVSLFQETAESLQEQLDRG